MNIRGVDIEVASAEAASAASEGPGPESGAPPDELKLRELCRSALSRGKGSGSATLRAPTPASDFPASASARVMAQEAIREARSGRSSLRRIVLLYPHPEGYAEFADTVSGYVKHMLDVLIWGPLVTVDAIIQTRAGIVLVRRSNPPLGLALPGGFVDYGESLEKAVRREAREETGLDLRGLRQFHTYSDPARDPRFHTVTTVFTSRAEGEPRAGDDAAAVQVVSPSAISGLAFAFDHRQILEDWLAERY